MSVEKQPCCYILTSEKNGTLYIGVTSDLLRRVYEHRSGTTEGFSSKYKVKNLVWYQTYATMEDAIQKEKRLKKWERAWKLKLIESKNPDWLDLYPGLIGESVFLDSRLRGNDRATLIRNDVSVLNEVMKK